jgi:dihydrofolate synthase/folylpolyglutamate synthase
MWIFQRQSIEVAILEVGLGGRLDAVNLFDASVALVTSISLDHMDFLGNDRESIGFEKAGIFRPHHPAVCSDVNPPKRLLAYAGQLQTPLYCQHRDFSYHKIDATHWAWQCQHQQYTHLPWPQLPGVFQLQNAAGVLMALTLSPFSMPETAIYQGLKKVHLAGRFQIVPDRVRCILDVAHNPAGVEALSNTLQDYPCLGQRHAVVGILQDKDIAGMLSRMKPHIDHWHVASLNAARSRRAEDLSLSLTTLGVTSIHRYVSIAAAYTSALSQAQPGDDVIVFGSFYTIAEVLQERAQAT